MVTESSVELSGFDVKASCAPTHIGEAKVTRCQEALTSYELSGCEAGKKCYRNA